MKKIKLEYLTEDDTLKTIAEQFWQTDKRNLFLHTIKDIGNAFDLSTYDIMKLVKESVRAYSLDYACYECDTPYLFTGRGHFNKMFRPPWLCETCQIKQDERQAAEEACQEALAAEQRAYENEEKRDWLKDQDHQRLEIEMIKKIASFEAVVYLLAFIRHCISEDLQYLDSYVANENSCLSPHQDFDEEICQSLAKKRLIVVDPNSNLNSLYFDGLDEWSTQKISYYPKQVKWKVSYDPKHYDSLEDFMVALAMLLDGTEMPDPWFDEIKPLCEEIAYQECVAYLNMMMEQHGFTFSPKAKTRLVITKALEDYSIAQVYNFIWVSVKMAENYFDNGNVMRPIAANSAIGNIQRRYETAKASDMSVKAFDRHYKLPMSALSQILFSSVLKAEDGWFNKPLHELWL